MCERPNATQNQVVWPGCQFLFPITNARIECKVADSINDFEMNRVTAVCLQNLGDRDFALAKAQVVNVVLNHRIDPGTQMMAVSKVAREGEQTAAPE